MGGGVDSTERTPTRKIYGQQIRQEQRLTTKVYLESDTKKSEWNKMWRETIGFSQGSSSDRLTDEQREDLIAENIYDWWISGKSYKRWYADKFLQLKFDLSEVNETQTSEENNGVE